MLMLFYFQQGIKQEIQLSIPLRTQLVDIDL